MEDPQEGAPDDRIYTSEMLLEGMREALGCCAGGTLEGFDSEVVGRVAQALEAVWEQELPSEVLHMRFELLEEWAANLQLVSFKYRNRVESLPREGRLADLQETLWGAEPCIVSNYAWEDGTPRMVAKLQIDFSQKNFSSAAETDLARFALSNLRAQVHDMSPPGFIVGQLRVVMYGQWAVLLDVRDLRRYAAYCHTFADEMHIAADSTFLTRVNTDLPELACGAGLQRAALIKPFSYIPTGQKRKRETGTVFSGDLQADGGFANTTDDLRNANHTRDNTPTNHPNQNLGRIYSGRLAVDGMSEEEMARALELEKVEGEYLEEEDTAEMITSDYADVDLTADDDDRVDTEIFVRAPYERGDGYCRPQAPDGSGTLLVRVPENVPPGAKFATIHPLPRSRICRTFSPRAAAFSSTEGTRNWALLSAHYTSVPLNNRGLPFEPLRAEDPKKKGKKGGKGGRGGGGGGGAGNKKEASCWGLRDVWLRVRNDRGTHSHPILLEMEITKGTFTFPRPLR